LEQQAKAELKDEEDDDHFFGDANEDDEFDVEDDEEDAGLVSTDHGDIEEIFFEDFERMESSGFVSSLSSIFHLFFFLSFFLSFPILSTFCVAHLFLFNQLCPIPYVCFSLTLAYKPILYSLQDECYGKMSDSPIDSLDMHVIFAQTMEHLQSLNAEFCQQWTQSLSEEAQHALRSIMDEAQRRKILAEKEG